LPGGKGGEGEGISLIEMGGHGAMELRGMPGGEKFDKADGKG
jgi:hypothetical protein